MRQICVNEAMSTGRIRRRVCHTQAEWDRAAGERRRQLIRPEPTPFALKQSGASAFPSRSAREGTLRLGRCTLRKNRISRHGRPDA